MVTSDTETIERVRLLIEEVGNSASAQAHFCSGAALTLLENELEWARRMLARSIPVGQAGRKAATRTAIRELLRCWVSLRNVLSETGEHETWPDIELSQRRIEEFLRHILASNPALLGSEDHAMPVAGQDGEGQWQEDENGMFRVRTDGLLLACQPFRNVWVAKFGGVFSGEAPCRSEAILVAEKQANDLFGNELSTLPSR